MYAFLLVLGAVIATAGLALVASGVSIQERAFDPTNFTPGTIALIGGCILIGLAFVVRALLRVERALTARPMPRPARPSEVVGAAASAAEHQGEAPRIPFPPKPKATPARQPAAAPSMAPPEQVEAAREKSAVAERVNVPPVVEAADASLLPNPAARQDDDHGAAYNGVAHGKLNGSAPAQTVARVSDQPVKRPAPKNSIFDSLWPKAQRPASEAQAAPALQASVPAARPQAGEAVAQAPQSQPAAVQHSAAAAVSVLKSGVVEGMAYTLYSDGSIEAQLPGGTLRFASITELRNHIERTG